MIIIITIVVEFKKKVCWKNDDGILRHKKFRCQYSVDTRREMTEGNLSQ